MLLMPYGLPVGRERRDKDLVILSDSTPNCKGKTHFTSAHRNGAALLQPRVLANEGP